MEQLAGNQEYPMCGGEHLIEQLRCQVKDLQNELEGRDNLISFFKHRLARLQGVFKTLSEEEAPLGIVFKETPRVH